MKSYCVICRSPRRRAAPRHRKGLKSDMATNGSGQVFRFHRLRLLELGEARGYSMYRHQSRARASLRLCHPAPRGLIDLAADPVTTACKE
jgi:hypothetical protein